jgi:DNA-binding transcriptional LysR family regulator
MKSTPGLDVRVLRMFEAVAASGSLSEGAKALGLTQSAVSQAIAQIEAILQTQVLDRSRRPLRLTPAGIALSRRARQIIDDVDRLVIHVRDADLASKPAIRVGMIDSFAATAGPEIVQRLTATASQVLFWSGLAYSQSAALLNRQLDLIVTPDPVEDADRLIRRSIFSEPFIVVVPATRAAEFRNVELKTLIERLPFIRFSGRSHFGSGIERYLRRCGHSPRPFLEIDTSDVVMGMVGAGLGWAITTPLCYFQARAYAAQVVAMPLPGPALSRAIYQVSREDEFEELAESCFQASRNVLQEEIFPRIRELLPWIKTGISLS